MKRLAFLVLGLFMAVAAAAQGFTAQLGASQFTAHGDGVWWQEPFTHQLNMRTPSVGLRYDTAPGGPLGLSYAVGYMNLGKVTTAAQAVALDGAAPGDGGYNPATRACNGECWRLSNWFGSGSVQGVYGAASKAFGPWSVEAGLYLYKPTWRMVIPDMVWCRECAPVHHVVTDSGAWNLGPMVGLKYRGDGWNITASAWQTFTRKTDYASAYYKATFNLSTGIEF